MMEGSLRLLLHAFFLAAVSCPLGSAGSFFPLYLMEQTNCWVLLCALDLMVFVFLDCSRD